MSILARSLMAQNRGGEAIAHLEKAARRSSDANVETLLAAARDGAPKRLNNYVRPRRGVRHLRRPSRNSLVSLPMPDASKRRSPLSKVALH